MRLVCRTLRIFRFVATGMTIPGVWLDTVHAQVQVPPGLVSDDIAQNSPTWRSPYTPLRGRLGLVVGDQAGGPIRYNTRFPELKSDPHPSSYYHAPAFAGLEGEFALRSGALLLGVMVRRDLWHKSIASRTVIHNGETWRVETFDFSGQALALGWVFGERYREATWSADCALIYDQGNVRTSLTKTMDASASDSSIQIKALSLRTRLHVGTVSSGLWQLSSGPEIHMPLWSQLAENSDVRLRGWVAEHVQLKNSAAIGLSVMGSVRL